MTHAPTHYTARDARADALNEDAWARAMRCKPHWEAISKAAAEIAKAAEAIKAEEMHLAAITTRVDGLVVFWEEFADLAPYLAQIDVDATMRAAADAWVSNRMEDW